MDLLIIEPLEAEVMQWLDARYAFRYAPELASDPRAFRQSLYNVRALIVPPAVTIDAQSLHYAPVLRAIGRVSAGAENIDLEACARARVEVVRGLTATAQAEAEFMIGALLSLLRRVPVVGSDGMLVGRELGAATVGLIDMGNLIRVSSLERLRVLFRIRMLPNIRRKRSNHSPLETWKRCCFAAMVSKTLFTHWTKTQQ